MEKINFCCCQNQSQTIHFKKNMAIFEIPDDHISGFEFKNSFDDKNPKCVMIITKQNAKDHIDMIGEMHQKTNGQYHFLTMENAFRHFLTTKNLFMIISIPDDSMIYYCINSFSPEMRKYGVKNVENLKNHIVLTTDKFFVNSIESINPIKIYETAVTRCPLNLREIPAIIMETFPEIVSEAIKCYYGDKSDPLYPDIISLIPKSVIGDNPKLWMEILKYGCWKKIVDIPDEVLELHLDIGIMAAKQNLEAINHIPSQIWGQCLRKLLNFYEIK